MAEGNYLEPGGDYGWEGSLVVAVLSSSQQRHRCRPLRSHGRRVDERDDNVLPAEHEGHGTTTLGDADAACQGRREGERWCLHCDAPGKGLKVAIHSVRILEAT